jgi:hypothetical protein
MDITSSLVMHAEIPRFLSVGKTFAVRRTFFAAEPHKDALKAALKPPIAAYKLIDFGK